MLLIRVQSGKIPDYLKLFFFFIYKRIEQNLSFSRFVADKRSFSHIDMRVEKFLYIFACANSVMDPIVYGYFNLRKKNRHSSKSQNLVIKPFEMCSMDCQ